TVVACGGGTRDPVRAAADLVPERYALPDRDHRQVVTVRPRLADAIRARVDHDRVLRPRAGRDHLAIGASGRDDHAPEEEAGGEVDAVRHGPLIDEGATPFHRPASLVNPAHRAHDARVALPEGFMLLAEIFDPASRAA